ncbi:hypothetical protein M408DRAFT_31258 [Serendipita vermifera MAFF 305830]|uniref:Secreted protein n=1 Tax=Serendipita vermifera MAFF 305830 TaxID=933852 RepID=A0A0C3AJ82_SERVB|nr:hypothetical protein M408DRAFT_31258 [Serendipita vermifera MAFF 305830]
MSRLLIILTQWLIRLGSSAGLAQFIDRTLRKETAKDGAKQRAALQQNEQQLCISRTATYRGKGQETPHGLGGTNEPKPLDHHHDQRVDQSIRSPIRHSRNHLRVLFRMG